MGKRGSDGLKYFFITLQANESWHFNKNTSMTMCGCSSHIPFMPFFIGYQMVMTNCVTKELTQTFDSGPVELLLKEQHQSFPIFTQKIAKENNLFQNVTHYP